MRKKILINLMFVLTLQYVNTYAQSTPDKIVNRFGDSLTEWCKTKDDHTYRTQLNTLVQGAVSCRVDDGIMKLFVEADETGFLSPGTADIDSYLNGFAHAISDNVKYKHDLAVWRTDMKEPTAFNDKSEAPLNFVSMYINVDGAINYSGTDLFFVRGGQITKIIDFIDPNSIGKAIELYSKNKYEEAFRIFRSLAYSDPSNFTAQYYTAVMEIKNQGCHFLDKKVRDIEAAWWITRGTLANKLKNDWATGRLEKLCIRFGIETELKTLPYSNIKDELFFQIIFPQKLISNGLMAYKDKKGKYGYIDENGKTVIPCKYFLALPFDKNGLALVSNGEKCGYVNKNGVEVIPLRYKNGMRQFVDGKTFVLDNEDLLLIDESGQILKNLGTGFSGFTWEFFNGCCYALNKNSNLYYLFDTNGEMVSVEKKPFSYNYVNNCMFIEDESGHMIKEEPFVWK